MRTGWHLSVGVAVVIGYLPIYPDSCVQAKDETDPKAAVVGFHKVPGQSPLKYDLTYVVEFIGLKQKINDMSKVGAGFSAEGLCLHLHGVLEQFKVQSKMEGKRLIITGLKDPKTGKFYPIKRITFTSQMRPKGVMIMPKAGMPKVTNPKLPAA